MDAAILYDAVAVAGNPALLTDAKAALIDAVRGRSAFMVHFARAIDAFPTPIGFFNNLTGDALDLKKGGIFSIVHGVRSLALERGLTETGTVPRIHRLVEAGRFSADFGRELIQAFYLLMTMRLMRNSPAPRCVRRSVQHAARRLARRLPRGEAASRHRPPPLQPRRLLTRCCPAPSSAYSTRPA